MARRPWRPARAHDDLVVLAKVVVRRGNRGHERNEGPTLSAPAGILAEEFP